MNTLFFRNNPHSDDASNELCQLGIIQDINGKMRGVAGISQKPKHQRWAGFGWQLLKVELTDLGLTKVKELKQLGDLTLDFNELGL